MSDCHFEPCIRIPEHNSRQPLFLLVRGQQLLCRTNSDPGILFDGDEVDTSGFPVHLLGLFHCCPCYVVDMTHAQVLPARTEWRDLRALLQNLSADLFNLAGRACQVAQWDLQHRYCGFCGSQTVVSAGDRSRRCNDCHAFFYPKISPCVIVLITWGDHCLLASSARNQGKLYSALAGFIEPGESAEQTIHREVMEEVGIRVDNLRYFGSQPWPFPGQLMIGFHADYHSGVIQVDGIEITQADWWRFDRLPPCPSSRTLSGQLIQHFVDSCLGIGPLP
ncbi:MAG: NADH pyrophosphatase [Porticoccus sp.]|jgi:NAD+ diphosphatase|uniref:NAD(+) diphosphatase n=1 Tax=Porticoccus TaxID=1123967 RepID=UPI00056A6AC9|nr:MULTISPECIES: NAD(+) diphosphatase [Porticoccus]MAZ70988.1 NADH pyrophosphatase [Porticoccus sp.]MBG57010.1 NADH pyrophosphatase [Porticoccus sp.]|tara:strand:- start:4722 stop:5555 length:834 start_codon:yes stop_codon:yes gene_type:complete